MAKGDMTQGGPESQFGSPAYDAMIQPATAAEQSVITDRFQNQIGYHLSDDKTAAARIFSNAYERQPNPAAVFFMGLSQQREFILDASERRWQLPFPGVALGPLTPVQSAPNVQPALGAVGTLLRNTGPTAERRNRRRFGRI